MVKGMLMDTEDETKSKPIAIDSGFRSGLARATIFRNEDAVGGALENVPGRSLDSIGDVDGGLGDGVGLASLESGWVARVLDAIRKYTGSRWGWIKLVNNGGDDLVQ
jgi:hypothetical protein